MGIPERVVIAGAGGILGSSFVRNYTGSAEMLLVGRQQLASERLVQLLPVLSDFRPTLVINCAADTNVEGAEDNRLGALGANAILPGILAQASKATGARFVHFSSTGCYGAWKDAPYSDFDRLEPTTVHHTSKALGEAAVREADPQALILRLGWVFGGQDAQRDFVRARIREAGSKLEMASDPSQSGNPTFAEDVVQQVNHLLDVGVTGTFNCIGSDPATRFDYVAAILQYSLQSTLLIPGHFPRRAPVSPNEAAIADKLNLLSLNIMRPWREALGQFIRNIL